LRVKKCKNKIKKWTKSVKKKKLRGVITPSHSHVASCLSCGFMPVYMYNLDVQIRVL
jgi:hypothetical protein